MKKLIYLSLLLLITGCSKKEQPGEVIALKIHPEALKYLKFDPGKYYIYRDSTTGRLDSVLISENAHTTLYVPAYVSTFASVPEHTTEAIQIILHRYGDSFGTEWLKAGGQSELGFSLLRYTSNDSASITLTETINMPGGGVTQIYGVFSSTSTPFSITVEGVTYPSVILGGFVDPTYYANSLREFYWARNVGVVKRVLTLNNVRYVSTLLRHGQR
jgi:hypothetical protein